MNSTVRTYTRKTNRGVAPPRAEAEVRVEKVLSVKRQLYEGRYSVAEKLSVALDRMLEELLQPKGCRNKQFQ